VLSPIVSLSKSNKWSGSDMVTFFSFLYTLLPKQSNRQGGARTVDLPARALVLERPEVAPPLYLEQRRRDMLPGWCHRHQHKKSAFGWDLYASRESDAHQLRRQTVAPERIWKWGSSDSRTCHTAFNQAQCCKRRQIGLCFVASIVLGYLVKSSCVVLWIVFWLCIFLTV